MNDNHAMLNSEGKQVKSVYAFGFNHQRADVALREKLAFSPSATAAILPQALKSLKCEELVIVSTCNRTEFYAVAQNPPDFLRWLANLRNMSLSALAQAAFFYTNREAISHLYRVACGLDSLILGEAQILGQLKQAYQIAKQSHSLSSILDRLFQQSFSVAKQIRYSTAIGENPVSVAYAGVKLMRYFFDDLPKRTAMVIGAGDTGRLVAKYLRDAQIQRLIIANRSLNNAQILAEETGGYAISLNQLNNHLHEADMIFGTARVEAPLLLQEHIQAADKKRRGQMQVLIDLGLPRNFDTSIEALTNSFLYGITDLEEIIDDNRKARKQAASQAEQIIKLYCDDFLGWLHSKPQQQLVRKIRDNADQIRQQLLQDAYRRLALGDDPAAVIEQLSYKLTRKLMHSPSTLIQAIPPNHKDWLAIVADSFNVHFPSEHD